MSKLHDPEDSVNMRLLGDALDGSTAVADDEEQWSTRSAPRRPFLGPSRSPSPNPGLARLRSRRVLLRIFYGTLLLAIGVLVIFVSRKPIVEQVRSWRNGPSVAPEQLDEQSSDPATHDHSLYVAGEPSARFRDNIVNGTKYVTSWPIGGFSNQVQAQINLLYLSIIALRIPVFADFVPGHMHGNPGFLPVSEVYDLPRLAEFLQKPVLEWNEFKNDSVQNEWEQIGCWSPHATIFKEPGHYASEREYALDISLTPVPDSRYKGDTQKMQNIMSLAALGWSEQRANALRHTKPIPSPKEKQVTEPDETMLCFDELYYADSVKAYEWSEEWSPMWNHAGKYMRWEPKMEELARSYIMRAFELGRSDSFPSYISVHIRHTDFASLCSEHEPGKCFAPLSKYGEKVDEIKAELLAKRGEHVESVLVTSDEEDEGWWATVREQGWHRINWVAEKTEENYSEWYPIVLDSVALSLGKGFVGTARSTLSLLAAKRVKDWENGFVRWVTLNS